MKHEEKIYIGNSRLAKICELIINDQLNRKMEENFYYRLEIYKEIDNELSRAEKLHPNFPKDIFHQLAIMQEESGEVAKAVNDFYYSGKPLQDVKDELIQTAAMCVRMIKNLPNQ